jgi:ribosomal protein L11 methyltransferase
MNYIKLIFEIKNAEEPDIISALLSDMNPQGFEENENQLLAFFHENEFNQATLTEILAPFSFTYKLETIPHENWNAQWESNFEPIRINNEVGVRANFHPPFSECAYDIIITPKMSFGTGHHETTQMMLSYECELDFKGKSVLDFGCGTGVLAIFASLKGASYVKGIDNDAWSIENARENCLMNHCKKIEITDQDIQVLNQTFNVILANINLNVLLVSMVKLKKLLAKDGQIILSGILNSDIPAILTCISELGLRLNSQKQMKDWVALHIN